MERKRRIYTDNFKMKCIGEMLDGKIADEVCRENGIISFSTLSEWMKAVLEAFFSDDKIDKLKKRQREIEAQLKEAKRLIREKERETEILRKIQHF